VFVRSQSSAASRLARRGARAVLDELEREAAAIRRAFPTCSAVAVDGRRWRRGLWRSPPAARMSAAGRKAVSERMKKYWADRRKGKAKK